MKILRQIIAIHSLNYLPTWRRFYYMELTGYKKIQKFHRKKQSKDTWEKKKQKQNSSPKSKTLQQMLFSTILMVVQPKQGDQWSGKTSNQGSSCKFLKVKEGLTQGNSGKIRQFCKILSRKSLKSQVIL